MGQGQRPFLLDGAGPECDHLTGGAGGGISEIEASTANLLTADIMTFVRLGEINW